MRWATAVRVLCMRVQQRSSLTRHVPVHFLVPPGDMVIEYAGELIRPVVSDLREKTTYDQLVGCGESGQRDCWHCRPAWDLHLPCVAVASARLHNHTVYDAC